LPRPTLPAPRFFPSVKRWRPGRSQAQEEIALAQERPAHQSPPPSCAHRKRFRPPGRGRRRPRRNPKSQTGPSRRREPLRTRPRRIEQIALPPKPHRPASALSNAGTEADRHRSDQAAAASDDLRKTAWKRRPTATAASWHRRRARRPIPERLEESLTDLRAETECGLQPRPRPGRREQVEELKASWRPARQERGAPENPGDDLQQRRKRRPNRRGQGYREHLSRAQDLAGCAPCAEN